MTDRAALLKAIEAVEKATEGYPELDVLITRAIFGYKPDQPLWYADKYSRSLDAARTLANDKILVQLSDIGADGLPLAVLADPSTTPTGEWQGIAATLPLAWCAAALRSRLESADAA